jgi:hypothetical protein
MSMPTPGPPRFREADFNAAPRLIEGGVDGLTAAHCNLDYWIQAVAQGTLCGLVNGHRPESTVPDLMIRDGPLRTALIEEFAFRSMAEEVAVRALSYGVINAPDLNTFEFFVTQLVDETRHARVFREHLVELGITRELLDQVREGYAGAERDSILLPLEKYFLPIGRDEGDFAGGVAILTVLAEGLLAPLAELSERKWRPFDPAAADIERGANIDELRHLAVGSSIVREHLQKDPDDAPRLVELLSRGLEVIAQAPLADVMYQRELLYQEGLDQHRHVAGDYELADGLRLVDTTAEQRMQLGLEWTANMQGDRLKYMGLEGALML